MTPKQLHGFEPLEVWQQAQTLYRDFATEAGTQSAINLQMLQSAVRLSSPGYSLAILENYGLISWRFFDLSLEILDLFVTQSARRRGMASLLLSWAIDQHIDATCCLVDVDPESAPGVALYKKLGFLFEESRLFYLGGKGQDDEKYFDVESMDWFPAAPKFLIQTRDQLIEAKAASLDRVWVKQPSDVANIAKQIYDFHPTAQRMKKILYPGDAQRPAHV